MSYGADGPLQRVWSGAPAIELRRVLQSASPGSVVIVSQHEQVKATSSEAIAILSAAVRHPGVATSSPIPVAGAATALYETHVALPPAPSLATPSRSLAAIDVDAVSSLGHIRNADGTAGDQLLQLGIQLLQHGWRHVGAPGVADGWDPADVAGAVFSAAWSQKVVTDLVGPANVGLETHQTWASSRLRQLRVIIDGACLAGDLHTGTQHLVIEVTAEMSAVRPDASITLAVPEASVAAVRARVGTSGISVVERNQAFDADVLYRPYQMLRVGEHNFVMSSARRRLIGQLDMIGFSNPFYHPSAELFGFARNLQRELMRWCDGVTFISEYGRQTAIAECPDLAPSRLHLVSCGADPEAPANVRKPATVQGERPFLLCLSASFWHKNRSHAVATFAALVEEHCFDGDLVVAGPEPFYGRSIDDDSAFIDSLPAGLRERIVFAGQVASDEKWWLLRQAAAVVYPSVTEGFGLVPFEAAAVGTPCLSYDGSAQHEVLGGTAATIASWAPSLWADRLSHWISDPAAAADAVSQVSERADGLTWRRCAELSWAAIDATLAQPPVSPADRQDGGIVSRIGGGGAGDRHLGTLRFTIARLRPAVGRRLNSLISGFRKAAK